jgi:AcrR family transcriptional regulator
LHAARQVFGESGYDAATFQEIAVRADLTRPAINHYFATKTLLYKEVIGLAHATVVAAGFEQARLADGFADRVAAFIRVAVGAQEQDQSVAAFLVTSVLECQRHPELRQDDYDVLQTMRAFADWALAEGVAHGELRADLDLDVTSELLAAMLCGLGFYAGFVGERERIPAVAAEFIAMVHENVSDHSK